MKPEEIENLRQQEAGAIVRHVSPFSKIEVPILKTDLSKILIDEFVKPFCLNIYVIQDEFLPSYKKVHEKITPDLVTMLLSYFDWRPRITAAYYVAIKRFEEKLDHIGHLLLRSDVCYAGKGYCIALAQLNKPKSIEYLCKYLDYYLTRKDLEYDQAEALSAISFLDAVNGTSLFESYKELWNEYSSITKIDLNETKETFNDMMKRIDEIRTLASSH